MPDCWRYHSCLVNLLLVADATAFTSSANSVLVHVSSKTQSAQSSIARKGNRLDRTNVTADRTFHGRSKIEILNGNRKGTYRMRSCFSRLVAIFRSVSYVRPQRHLKVRKRANRVGFAMTARRGLPSDAAKLANLIGLNIYGTDHH